MHCAFCRHALPPEAPPGEAFACPTCEAALLIADSMDTRHLAALTGIDGPLPDNIKAVVAVAGAQFLYTVWDEDALLTLSQVAAITGKKLPTIYQQLRDGQHFEGARQVAQNEKGTGEGAERFWRVPRRAIAPYMAKKYPERQQRSARGAQGKGSRRSRATRSTRSTRTPKP